MSYSITGLPAERFQHLYGLSDFELGQHGARRCVVDKKPGFPDRIGVCDVEPGQAVILLNFLHQPAAGPYQSSHAIFVREGAAQTFRGIDCIPEALRVRTISLRAFDAQDEMVDADIVDGGGLEPLIEQFFSNVQVSYLHAHYAKRGCYAARVDRR